MIRINTSLGIASVVLALLVASDSAFAQKTPGYNNKIPPQIMTPDSVETRIGTLEFFDGMPSKKTVETVYDNLDLLRGVEVFLNCVPPASLEAMRRGNIELGATKSNRVAIFETLMDSNSLFLTANTDTVYAMTFLDLKTDGPTVVEIPPGCGPGTVNDAWFRFVIDMGAPGPDKGKGGKYLILPPDFKEEVPKGYFVGRSTSYANWLILRGFLVDGKPDTATKMFKDGLKIYPLKVAKNPPAMVFENTSGNSVNTVHANTFAFYEELNAVIQREPIEMIDPETRGLLASIGIQKGKPFEPNARMKKILTEAAAIGNATARAIWLKPRDKSAYLYENSGWYKVFLGGSYQWLKDGGKGGRYQDARTLFFYAATVNTPAMAAKMVGKGSQYAFNATDRNGEYLDGRKNYKLNIPADVPAKDFWSVVVYDPQTRCELQTSQPFPSRNNKRDDLIVNSNGSVDLYFGPKPPKGKERNWVQTTPGKGWFVLLRLYGPLEPWFDKTWRPGEFEVIE